LEKTRALFDCIQCLCETQEQPHLRFGGKPSLNIRLETTQQKGPEDALQTRRDMLGPFRALKQSVELFGVCKVFGQQKVE